MKRQRLQRLIAAKERLRAVQQANLARAAAHTAEAEDAAAAAQAGYVAAAQAMGTPGSFSAGDMQHQGAMAARLRLAVEVHRGEASERQLLQDGERERLVEATREVQVLDILRERAAEEDRLRERRSEQQTMDEIASRVRRRR